jgi:hypothetical protein
MPIIASNRKSKIGSYLSYPLKFSDVAQTLESAVEDLEVNVRFSDAKAPRQNEQRPTYSVISANYLGGNDPSVIAILKLWSVTIYPVPRELRSVVRSALIPRGISMIRTWIAEPHTQLWLNESHAFQLRYVVATESLE